MKTLFYSTIIGIIVFFFSCNLLNAQSTNSKNDWELFKETQGIKIFTKVQEYHDNKYDQHQEYYILKFVNTTSENVNVSWKTELWYNNKCITCNSESEEYKFSIKINANDAVEGDVNIKDNTFRIFKRFLNYKDKSELTKFDLTNLKIN